MRLYLDDDSACQDQVRARRLDARDARPLGGRQRREPLDQLINRLAGDDHPLDTVRGQPRGALGSGRSAKLSSLRSSRRSARLTLVSL